MEDSAVVGSFQAPRPKAVTNKNPIALSVSLALSLRSADLRCSLNLAHWRTSLVFSSSSSSPSRSIPSPVAAICKQLEPLTICKGDPGRPFVNTRKTQTTRPSCAGQDRYAAFEFHCFVLCWIRPQSSCSGFRLHREICLQLQTNEITSTNPPHIGLQGGDWALCIPTLPAIAFAPSRLICPLCPIQFHCPGARDSYSLCPYCLLSLIRFATVAGNHATHHRFAAACRRLPTRPLYTTAPHGYRLSKAGSFLSRRLSGFRLSLPLQQCPP